MKSNLALIVLLSSVAPACGSEAAPLPSGSTSSNGGTATGTGTGTGNATDGDAGGSNTTALPPGTCAFTLAEGTTKTSWTGTAQARMNGSGNLSTRCVGRTEGATEDTTIEIQFGNASFDGPRTYRADDFSSDGRLVYQVSSDVSYLSDWKGSSCTLVLVEAGPLDGRGSSVLRGGRVSGTFGCTKLVSPSEDHPSPPLAIESGVIAVTVE